MAPEPDHVQRSVFPCTAQELYDWHTRDGALERLIPPWDRTRVLARRGGIEPGASTLLRLRLGPLPVTFAARHLENQPGRMFRDRQETGPFALWEHTHLFYDTPEGAVLEDRIRYRLPLQRFLPPLALRAVRSALARTFQWRHRTLAGDLALHRNTPGPLRILLTGAGGVIGQALAPLLTTGGHQVWTLVRSRSAAGDRRIYWNPDAGVLHPAELPEVDAVIHLAGEAIGLNRWSAAKKQRILESRVKGTRLLAEALARSRTRPATLLSASAIGYYGDRGMLQTDEQAPAGKDFISRVCREWEEAAAPATAAGIRTVLLRIGVVLTPRGGGLKRMVAGFRPTYIRRFGRGDQIISWIHIDDMVSALLHVLDTETLQGALNVAAPEPVANREFMATLARIMGRPLFPPVPAWLLRALFGQMASEVVLAGCRVSVDKLLKSGYQFRHPSLEPALRDLLGKQILSNPPESEP